MARLVIADLPGWPERGGVLDQGLSDVAWVTNWRRSWQAELRRRHAGIFSRPAELMQDSFSIGNEVPRPGGFHAP
jgi:hypothetical protein